MRPRFNKSRKNIRINKMSPRFNKSRKNIRINKKGGSINTVNIQRREIEQIKRNIKTLAIDILKLKENPQTNLVTLSINRKKKTIAYLITRQNILENYIAQNMRIHQTQRQLQTMAQTQRQLQTMAQTQRRQQTMAQIQTQLQTMAQTQRRMQTMAQTQRQQQEANIMKRELDNLPPIPTKLTST